MRCGIVRMIWSSSLTFYGPLSATPKSTGWSAGVLQRQPPSVFWKANAFSIRNLRATEKPSLITHDGFGWPGMSLQHMPVQLDAIGLQTANGASTIISTSAVTSALCSAISLSISNTRLTLRKSWQALAEWICATHRSTPSASGGRFQRLRNLTIEMLACYRSRDWQGALEAIERGRKTDEANALKLLYNLYEARIRDKTGTAPLRC
jgi:hypothetical protein